MKPLLIILGRIYQFIKNMLRNHEFMVLFLLVAITLITGTIFYHRIEEWRYLDSLYFSMITLTTVGYGDIFPKTDAGKIFTMIYLVVGIGIIFGFINLIAQHAKEHSSINDLVKKSEVIDKIVEDKKKRIKKFNKKMLMLVR